MDKKQGYWGHALDNGLITDKFEDLGCWWIKPKIAKKKKSFHIETIIVAHTNVLAFESHQEEQEFCDANDVKVEWKNAVMEYTKKVSFLIDTYAKLVSPKECIK